MDFGKLHFGSIAINGVTYEHVVVIDRGKIRSARRSLQEIPRAVRTHPSLSRGEGTLEVPVPRNWHGKLWLASGDG